MNFNELTSKKNTSQTIKNILNNPHQNLPTIEEAIEISKDYNIALHPRYTLYLNELSAAKLITLIEFIEKKLKIKEENNKIKYSYLPAKKHKRDLELIGLEHKIKLLPIEKIKSEDESEILIINSLNTKMLLANLGIFDFKNEPQILSKQIQNIIEYAKKNLSSKPTEIISKCSKIEIRDKGGTYIGARMGRPEKAKMRKQFNDETKSHGLFPVGAGEIVNTKRFGSDETHQEIIQNRLKNLNVALKTGYVEEEFRIFYCDKCKIETIYHNCEKCHSKTNQLYFKKYTGEQITKEELILTLKKSANLMLSYIKEEKLNKKHLEEIEKISNKLNEEKDISDLFETAKTLITTSYDEIMANNNFNNQLPEEIKSLLKIITSTRYKKIKLDLNSYEKNLRKVLGSKVELPKHVKGITATINKHHTTEHLAKSYLRALNNVYVNKDGTVRYDMIEMGLTHFKPKEIGTSIKKLKELGYTHDYLGKPLENEDQLLEIFPQDVILPDCLESGDEFASDYIINTGNFVDDLLEKLYNLPRFYNFKTKEDTVGHLLIGLAPHTSAGIVGRILGYSKTQGCFSHPVWHAAQRRNLDGDENGIMLLLDGLINSSREYLPDRRGSRSVTSDTIIFIQENNKIKTVEIGKFIDEKFKTGFEKEEDNFETKKIKNLKAISFNSKTGKVSFENVTKLIRHENDKITYEIKTSEGWIKTTQDHSIFSLDYKTGKIIEKKASELKKGDFIVTLGKINLNNEKKINKIINISELKLNLDTRGIQIPKLIELNKYFYRILGFILAEGYFNNYKIEIGNTNKEIINLICKDIEKTFNYKPIINLDKRENKYTNKKYYRINLPAQYGKLLIKLGVSTKKADEKEIPDFLFRENIENILAFIEGYCLSDGTSYMNNKSKQMIRLYTSSVKLSSGLSLLAYLAGKKSTCRKTFYKEKKSTMYEVCISNYKQRSTFWSLYHIRKELNNALINSGIDSKKRISLLSNINLNSRLKTCSKQKIEKIKDNIINNSNNKKTIEKLKKILNQDIRLEIVNEIKEINVEGNVYDLEVPKHQNFLCGPHPIFAHNTMDVSLVLTAHLYLDQIDDEVHGMDIVPYYPLEFYKANKEFKSPKDVKIEKVSKRIEKEKIDERYLNYKFTHNTDNMNDTIMCSSYKSVPSMTEKLDLQLGLGKKIRAVDENQVGSLIIDKHFMKDIKGNLRKFSMQTFRCTNCGEKYRRPPLIGKCVKCNMPSINFTIHEGSIKKYILPSFKIIKEYNVDPYLVESLELTNLRIEGLFGKELEKQKGLNEFFK